MSRDEQLNKLRREAELLLARYQASDDADEMKRLSSRYDEVESLISSAEQRGGPSNPPVSALEGTELPTIVSTSTAVSTPPVKGRKREDGTEMSPLLDVLRESLKHSDIPVPQILTRTPRPKAQKPAELPTPPIKPPQRQERRSDSASRKRKTRTCPFCDEQTRFDIEVCKSCGNRDESLNILNEVIAGNVERVRDILLVKPHVITTQTRTNGWSLLHMATSTGNREMAELLLNKGASVNARSRNGKTALHYAAGRGYGEIVDLLLANLADTTVKYNGRTPEQLAEAKGHRDIAEKIRDWK